MNTNDIPAVAIQVSRDTLIASIQVDLDDEVIARFRDDVLRRLHETGTRGVILDLSGVETLDSHEFGALRLIINMIEIMGAQCVLTGMKPGVVSALIEVGADVDGLCTAIDLDAAFIMLEPQPETEAEQQPEAPGADDQGESLSTGDDLISSAVLSTSGEQV